MYRFGPELRAAITERLGDFDRIPAPAAVLTAGRESRIRHAAVAVCVIPDAGGDACFVLTRRAAGLRAHARQWALPGGRVDEGESAVDAAIREVEEEVGLRLSSGAVLGGLDDYATRSGFLISPAVIWSDDCEGLAANAGEVASIHLVPLVELDRPDAPRLIAIPESEAPVIQMPIEEHLVHAPTGAILLQFREVALHGRPTRVNHYEQPTWAWR
ncbi:MAG TPA: CoA pyrophosphatase [Acidimicrobiales bacterium]